MSFLTQYRSHDVMMPDKATPRLRGWHFLLFNLVLGLAHMAVLFNAASFIAFLPHVAGDLGGVLPSFGTVGADRFHDCTGLGISHRAVVIGALRRELIFTLFSGRQR